MDGRLRHGGSSPLTACTSDRDAAQEWLFLQTSSGGSYAYGVLTLDSVEYTVAFTDHPERQVMHLANGGFAAAWDEGEDSFAGDPPNTALGYKAGDTSGQAIVKLTDIDVKDSTIIYSLEFLEGEIPEGSFDRITLVIDALGLITPSDQGRH